MIEASGPIVEKERRDVCRWLDGLELSPLALALYVHYQRVTFGNGVHPNIRQLKDKFHVSSRAIARAKIELVNKHLIRIYSDPPSGRPDKASIVFAEERRNGRD